MSLLESAKDTPCIFEAKCKYINEITLVFKLTVHVAFGFAIGNRTALPR